MAKNTRFINNFKKIHSYCSEKIKRVVRKAFIFIIKNEFDHYTVIIVSVYSVSLKFETIQTKAPWANGAFLI